jgi:hypothetical protein
MRIPSPGDIAMNRVLTENVSPVRPRSGRPARFQHGCSRLLHNPLDCYVHQKSREAVSGSQVDSLWLTLFRNN